ncbi:MAG TPA: hypothetical protein VFV98_16420 [Vicinamibacterales bacterium]|nr:hypothetical protein [Vicinamibacterales bacterium]
MAVLVAAQGLPALSSRHLFADADAGGPVLAIGHTAAQFEAVRTPVADEHCAICHWMRAVNGAAPGSPLATSIATDLEAVATVGRPTGYALDLAAEQPSRAPPARS